MAYSGLLSWQTKSLCRGIHFPPELPRRAASKVNNFLSDGNAQSFSPEPFCRDPAVPALSAPHRSAAREPLYLQNLQRRASGSRVFESALSRMFDKPCRLRALTSESILSQMGTMEWNEKLILNQ